MHFVEKTTGVKCVLNRIFHLTTLFNFQFSENFPITRKISKKKFIFAQNEHFFEEIIAVKWVFPKIYMVLFSHFPIISDVIEQNIKCVLVFLILLKK